MTALNPDYFALAVKLAHAGAKPWPNTAIVQHMRETANELGITDRLVSVLNCSCRLCPSCAAHLEDALRELIGPAVG